MYNYKDENTLTWESIDVNGNKWFEAAFSAADFDIIETSNYIKAEFLQKLLKNAAAISENKKWYYLDHIKNCSRVPKKLGVRLQLYSNHMCS